MTEPPTSVLVFNDLGKRVWPQPRHGTRGRVSKEHGPQDKLALALRPQHPPNMPFAPTRGYVRRDARLRGYTCFAISIARTACHPPARPHVRMTSVAVAPNGRRIA